MESNWNKLESIAPESIGAQGIERLEGETCCENW